MAAAAIVVGRHVEAGLPRCGRTVVARLAVINDSLMIKVSVGKRFRRVAHRAIIAGGNVRRVDLGRLAGCINAVVTGGAVVGDTVVIEKRRCEGASGYMADAAILVGHNVIEFGVLTGRINPVMTGIASAARDFGIGMVDESVCKTYGVVAISTISAGVLVNGRLRLTASAKGDVCRAAIVARRTGSADSHMIKYRWGEQFVRMADITILARGQMI